VKPIRDGIEVSYLHWLKLLSKAEIVYFNALSPDSSDWDLLQRKGWVTVEGRRRWFLMWCRALTEKGVACYRRDLLYLQGLGLSPVVPLHDMGPESEYSSTWKLADFVIIPV
jgi:hypothetical protein